MDSFTRRTRQILFKHFDSLMDLIPDGVYISDRSGKTLLVNAPYQGLTGIAANELLGKNVLELKETGVFSTIVNPEVVATGEKVTSVQVVNGRKVVLSGHPIFDTNDQVELVVTFVRDITAFERLKQDIAAQQALLDYYQRQVSSLAPDDTYLEEGIIAASPVSIRLWKAIDKIAPTDATVLIMGETGVGKDVVARRIHRLSQRWGKPYLKVDCSAIPESLVESELFGYAPGAFSGAHHKGKAGFFENANEGTLFLDEIGELSMSMQTKLLRAIEDQEIIRLGSATVTPINVRIVAATNRDLEKAVAKGTFRSDLFYRLKVALIQISPLRDRKEDILSLAKLFLKRFNHKYRKNITFDSQAENILLNYHWPGNVREMENMIHSLVITSSKSKISGRNLPIGLTAKAEGSLPGSRLPDLDLGRRSLKEIIIQLEKEVIDQALATYGSMSKVAEVLQVDRSTLFRKMRSLAGPKPLRKKRPVDRS